MKKHYIALTLTIIMALLTLSGCIESNISPDCSDRDASLESKVDQNSSLDASLESKVDQNSSLSAEKITYVTCDWPYYNTLQSLCEAATDIFEGKVSDVFFKIIDMRSGNVVDDKKVDDKTYLRLYTVYEIDVTDSYKKAESNKMYVCVSTGFEGYKEAEQRDLMKSAGIYNESTGIQVVREFGHLQIGQSYLFLTVDLGGTYNYIVNADQFAFDKSVAEKSETFGYLEIKTFVANQNQDVVDKDSAVNNNANNENPQAVAQPAPPIQAGSINEVVSLLVKSDTKGYSEGLQLQYQELFSRLKKSGFIYQVVTSGNVATKDAITLFERDGKNLFFIMPYAQYEDAGIVSYVMFRGEVYQVCIYNADEKVLPKTDSVSEYIKTRLSIDVSNEMAESKNTVCFMTEGDGKDYQKNCAAAFIDNDHYYVVKTEASQDQLKAFINVLSFEKMSIE